MSPSSIERRRFLKLLAWAPLAAGPLGTIACAAVGRGGGAARAAGGIPVNDVHSRLGATRVARVLEVASPADVRRAILEARDARAAVAIAGGRHAMGGQQFVGGGWLLDTRPMNGVIDFDDARGRITVEGGMQWPELLAHLDTTRNPDGDGWAIVQKPSGVDRVTIAGTLSSNGHGRVLTEPPIVHDVDRIVLIDGDGLPITASREENYNLFRLALGGYGLFGVIVEATLRLAKRMKMRRYTSEANVEDVTLALRDRATLGHLYGDVRLSSDPADFIGFLRTGIMTTYEPVPIETEIPVDQRTLSPEDLDRLLELAHTDPAAAVREYTEHFLATDGQIYWNDEMQLAGYGEDQHARMDAALGSDVPGGETLTELYVPRERLGEFMTAARAILRPATSTPVIEATVRLIEEDEVTFLAWARERYACVTFALHVPHTAAAAGATVVRELIDEALERGGSFSLTYHRWATVEQVLTAYPLFGEFLELKRVYDPRFRFQSDWYRHYRDLPG